MKLKFRFLVIKYRQHSGEAGYITIKYLIKKIYTYFSDQTLFQKFSNGHGQTVRPFPTIAYLKAQSA